MRSDGGSRTVEAAEVKRRLCSLTNTIILFFFFSRFHDTVNWPNAHYCLHFCTSAVVAFLCYIASTPNIEDHGIAQYIFPDIYMTCRLWQMSADSVALVMLLPTVSGFILLHLFNSSVMSMLAPSYGRQWEANEAHQSQTGVLAGPDHGTTHMPGTFGTGYNVLQYELVLQWKARRLLCQRFEMLF